MIFIVENKTGRKLCVNAVIVAIVDVIVIKLY